MILVIIYSFIYLTLFGLTELLYHKFAVPAEHTRKIVHITTGCITLTFPVYLSEIWQVGFLTISFLGLMFISEKKRWFKSITGIERKSYGSWLFALVVLICFATYSKAGPIYYYLPILILTLSDPSAALFGRIFNYKPFQIFGQKKSLGGSIAFFVVAIAVQFIYLWTAKHLVSENIQIDSSDVIKFCSIAFIAALAEAFSIKGWDNLTIPVSVIIMLFALGG